MSVFSEWVRLLWIRGGCSGVDAGVLEKVWVFWSVRGGSWSGVWCSDYGDGVRV